MSKNKHKEPILSGKQAEDFVEFLSGKTFLKPWVFKNPICADGDEFSDVAIFFKEKLILIEVKGNKFNPQNPQRYLKEAKDRHRQLKRAANIAKNKTKEVDFKNDYFSFRHNFKSVESVYLISVSTGPGEMDIASGDQGIDYSKLDHVEVSKYLGFLDPESSIHSFTAEEFFFMSKHVDSLKDFFWYLDFEKKFLCNKFELQKENQTILAVVDMYRQDLISIYILNFYWDDELNKTGVINVNKILGNTDVENADMVMYAGTDTRQYLEDDKNYKKIKEEKRISYFWDNLINNVLSDYENAYKIDGTSPERKKVDLQEMRELLEAMSDTSRLERVYFSEKIKEADEGGYNFRNMLSLADGAEVLFSYSKIEYEKFPTKEEQERRSSQHLYSVWCRINYGKNMKPYRDKIKKALLITRHVFKDQSALSFSLSHEINVDKGVCKQVGVI